MTTPRDHGGNPDAAMARWGGAPGAWLDLSTPLFRTYATPDPKATQEALARHRVYSRIFLYSDTWIRLDLPEEGHWEQLETAIEAAL